MRNKDRLDNNKKIADKDNEYFNKAERYLYNKIAYSFNKTYEEVKNYVINKVKEIIN